MYNVENEIYLIAGWIISTWPINDYAAIRLKAGKTFKYISIQS